METHRRKRWIGLVVLVAGIAAAAVIALSLPRGQFDWRGQGLLADLRRPDVLVRSARLSALPKDLVQAPLLRGILTEDFVTYYESHPARLSIAGTAKRLAYDHPLSLSDRLVATVLDAPGEIALWRDGQGRLSHFALVLEHNLATRAALELAKVGLPDKQLSVAGELGSIFNRTPVYALRLDGRTTWLIASRDDRTVVLSHPGLLLEGGAGKPKDSIEVDTPRGTSLLNRDAAAALADLLDTPAGGATPFAEAFSLDALGRLRQQLVARTDFLSFGYQHFFPAVDALNTQLGDDGRWTLAAHAQSRAVEPWRRGATELWRQLPRSNALCASLPVDPSRVAPLFLAAGMGNVLGLLADVEPTAAVCWGAGGLFAPMVALPLRPGTGARHDATFEQLLQTLVRQPPAGGAAPQVVESHPLSHGDRRLWTRAVVHALGAVEHEGDRADVVGIARIGDMLFASTDQRNLRQVLAVAAKTQSSLSDRPMAQATAVLGIDGPQLARLLETQTWRTLRPEVAPTFSRVARELLPPRLAAVAQLGQVQVGLPAVVEASTAQWRWVDLPVVQAPAADTQAK